jgi:hypothetical protein
MRHRGRLIGVAVLAGVSFAQDKPAPQKPRPQPVRTVVGCLDQRGESYVLSGDRELRRIVTLEGDGFSNDNFARYLGHKVRVRGRLSAAGSSVFRAREIVTLSETCKPEEP